MDYHSLRSADVRTPTRIIVWDLVTEMSYTRLRERKSSPLYILKASLTLSLPMSYVILRTIISWSRLVSSLLQRLLWLCFLFFPALLEETQGESEGKCCAKTTHRFLKTYVLLVSRNPVTVHSSLTLLRSTLICSTTLRLLWWCTKRHQHKMSECLGNMDVRTFVPAPNA